MTDIRPSILIVDDDLVMRTRLARAFTERGYDTRLAAHYDEAMAQASSDPPELAVIDLRMPGRSGLELIKELKGLDPATRVFGDIRINVVVSALVFVLAVLYVALVHKPREVLPHEIANPDGARAEEADRPAGAADADVPEGRAGDRTP